MTKLQANYQTTIDLLVEHYQRLSFWQRWFYPKRLARTIEQYQQLSSKAHLYDIGHALVHEVSGIQHLLFPFLKKRLWTPLLMLFRKADEAGQFQNIDYRQEIFTPLETEPVVSLTANRNLVTLKETIEIANRYIFSSLRPFSGLDSEWAYAFCENAYNGRWSTMEEMIAHSPEETQVMITTGWQYDVFFVAAAAGGHWLVMENLMTRFPELCQVITEKHYQYAFWAAAGNGHWPVMEHLIARFPKEKNILDMVLLGFTNAIDGNHWSVIENLMTRFPEYAQAMIATKDFAVFRMAARYGNWSMMEHLMARCPKDIHAMLAASNYKAFDEAAENGHWSVMERLMTRFPKEAQKMVMRSPDGSPALINAAANGNLSIMECLIAHCQDPQKIIESGYDYPYQAFRVAASNGDWLIMESLIAHCRPENIQQMVKAGGYTAFRSAAENGHWSVMENLMTRFPEQAQAMLTISQNGFEFKEDGYGAFCAAVEKDHAAIIHHLLVFPGVMAFAESHHASNQHIFHFIKNKIAALKSKQEELQRTHPQAVLNVEGEEVKMCFYMIRILIKKNYPKHFDFSILNDIRYLLSIPSVRAIAHQAITSDQPNELLRLAVSHGCLAEAKILMDIPAVSTLAVQNNYYPREARSDLDLSILTRNDESLVRALTNHYHYYRSRTIDFNALIQNDELSMNTLSTMEQKRTEQSEQSMPSPTPRRSRISDIGFFQTTPACPQKVCCGQLDLPPPGISILPRQQTEPELSCQP